MPYGLYPCLVRPVELASRNEIFECFKEMDFHVLAAKSCHKKMANPQNFLKSGVRAIWATEFWKQEWTQGCCCMD